MKWWYENEEDVPRKITLVDYDKEGKPFYRDVVVPKTAEEARRLEMEFDKLRVFTALNADELRAGDKVIVAYNLYGLKEQVKMYTESAVDIIEVVQDEDYFNRFKIKHGESYPLAYLVERKENCTNCEGCGEGVDPSDARAKVMVCSQWKPKTEQKAEPHYRPFEDTDELIKVWCDKGGKWSKRELTMPHIWVRRKNDSKDKGVLITGFGFKAISVGIEGNSMRDFFNEYEFLDGSVCGVEE